MIYLHLLLKCLQCTVWDVLEMVCKILETTITSYLTTTLTLMLAPELLDFIMLIIKSSMVQYRFNEFVTL